MVIPEDEAPQQEAGGEGGPGADQLGQGGDAAAEDDGAGEGAGDGGSGAYVVSGGGVGEELATLREEVVALSERVAEMEKMVGRGTAPQLRAIIQVCTIYYVVCSM